MEKTGFLPSLLGRGKRPGQDMFTQLQGEVDRVFDSFSLSRPLAHWNGRDGFEPAIDVTETPDALEVTAEIPGCDPKDIEVSLVGQQLYVRGEKKSEKEEKGKNHHRIERSFGAFMRTIPLPFLMDPAKVEARFDNGVLKVHLPKPPEAKTAVKTIPIKS
jgi:HSP20 family protein